MKLKLFVILLATVNAGLCVAQAGASVDEADIRKAVAQYEQGWNTHDGRMLARCFTEDADFINIFGTHLKGRAGIEKMLSKAHAGWAHTSEMHLSIDKISFLSPEAAVVLVTFPLTLSGGADTSQDKLAGFVYDFTNGPHVGVRVMQKVQGHWLIQLFENTKVLDAQTMRLIAKQ